MMIRDKLTLLKNPPVDTLLTQQLAFILENRHYPHLAYFRTKEALDLANQYLARLGFDCVKISLSDLGKFNAWPIPAGSVYLTTSCSYVGYEVPDNCCISASFLLRSRDRALQLAHRCRHPDTPAFVVFLARNPITDRTLKERWIWKLRQILFIIRMKP